jgi:hypothetical protein
MIASFEAIIAPSEKSNRLLTPMADIIQRGRSASRHLTSPSQFKDVVVSPTLKTMSFINGCDSNASDLEKSNCVRFETLMSHSSSVTVTCHHPYTPSIEFLFSTGICFPEHYPSSLLD